MDLRTGVGYTFSSHAAIVVFMASSALPLSRCVHGGGHSNSDNAPETEKGAPTFDATQAEAVVETYRTLRVLQVDLWSGKRGGFGRDGAELLDAAPHR